MAVVDVLLLVSIALSALTVSSGGSFDVTHFGARGDGKTDDSKAFVKAWKAACGAGGSATLIVPQKTYFLNPVAFMGPCKSSVIQVQINGNLVAPSTRGAWQNCYSNTWIAFSGVNGLKISGKGSLEANGKSWWGRQIDSEDSVPAFSNGGCVKPTTFSLFGCNSAQLTGLTFLNSGRNHIGIDNCNHLDINHITIKAPQEAYNTDGIDIAASNFVNISRSFIGTGDDCIAINNNVKNVHISFINCGPGHSISVGSLGRGSSAAVDGIIVEHCTFTGTNASARIKTWAGGSGYAKNIFYDHITLKSVMSAIEINQEYTAVNPNAGGVQVSNVHFTNVQGSGNSIKLDCNPNVPCQNILLQQVSVKSATPQKQVEVTCKNAQVKQSSVTPALHC